MKPILFNAEMVKAILHGEKTMTRRVIKPQYRDGDAGFRINKNAATGQITGVEIYDENGLGTCRYVKPPYQVGDELYVRETWSKSSFGYIYRTDDLSLVTNNYDEISEVRWRPSIHMPKEAARMLLKVTDVRVEQLQNITIEDIRKEGCGEGSPIDPNNYASEEWYEQAGLDNDFDKASFAGLWNATIEKKNLEQYGWEANPWVWVIAFRPIYKHVSVLSKLDEQAIATIKAALDGGENIIITGASGSGKTTLYKDILPLISNTRHDYIAFDEVVTTEDIAYINSYLNRGRIQGLLLTAHYKNAELIKEAFPEFKGLWIYLNRSIDNYMKANVRMIE